MIKICPGYTVETAGTEEKEKAAPKRKSNHGEDETGSGTSQTDDRMGAAERNAGVFFLRPQGTE